jgi:hypothetical protein
MVISAVGSTFLSTCMHDVRRSPPHLHTLPTKTAHSEPSMPCVQEPHRTHRISTPRTSSYRNGPTNTKSHPTSASHITVTSALHLTHPHSFLQINTKPTTTHSSPPSLLCIDKFNCLARIRHINPYTLIGTETFSFRSQQHASCLNAG